MTEERYREICVELGFEYNPENLYAYDTDDEALELKFTIIKSLGRRYKLYKDKDSFPGFFSIGNPSFWVDIHNNIKITCDEIYEFNLDSELSSIVETIDRYMATTPPVYRQS